MKGRDHFGNYFWEWNFVWDDPTRATKNSFSAAEGGLGALKPIFISEGLRGPEGPLFYGDPKPSSMG
jgi:hypothetical protein